ncbi:acyl-CoA dehydrogenase family protein [Nocardia terpenica]|uniref:acyl-CoA dehydrogenase family protein n=1 Tax=Nocardia terpenica TaxID=455432 RepID=UPI0018954845|nr:acyl-CoA dehydrogenase [Nocardia terpenica]MBF6064276.1 acyl-CoA dehydrogenase family protein [Nocardia terpenica]MBF6106609.1 acyl-CoA dehydrogenase family protein [Nocardia terpenica]MBF6113894.1 acyl-CoA dehydrogenase family protein [Nocardia terpenica]MBF6120482.1 acyl-CoA dehydrogenase family protein [Nocardia terpenica]MBF6154861.1 acyl-CoA dehydrogenase family protein [Nocardia terpenica]
MATASKSTADHLRAALDGPWREVREQARRQLDDDRLYGDPFLDYRAARARVLDQMRLVREFGYAERGFRLENGGTGDPGGAVTGLEMLAYADLSLWVKSGVQWGLFGGAVENLGTERHRDVVRRLLSLDLLGCFAMTESGHGSDVARLETTATYDPATAEFVVHSPTESARKDYIGGAAEHARMAAVFAQLIIEGESKGVHCFLVPIRDERGSDLPGVTTSDCGLKGGLPGVDNGRIRFDHVRIPRENLLNRYADVTPEGTYSSEIENPSRRFFTTLGTLVRGRVSVGGAAAAGARVALSIALRYADKRRQFADTETGEEVVLLDYRSHQRRLLPHVARAFALAFAQNDLVRRMHVIQTGQDLDPHAQRALEKRAAGLKIAQTRHATRAIQECREACGGAGYLTENRLVTLKADTDVFTTFEGDNVVLTQLVAKELLTAYSDEVRDLDALGWVRFAATMARDVVRESSGVRQLIQRLRDRADDGIDDGDLSRRSVQLQLFADREDYLVRTAAHRLRARAQETGPFEAFNNAQDHILIAGEAHIERLVLEAFIEGIAGIDDPAAREVADTVCDLYVYSTIEQNQAWYIMHRFMSVDRAKTVRRGVNELVDRLRPQAATLVEALGVPETMLHATMLDDASVHQR